MDRRRFGMLLAVAMLSFKMPLASASPQGNSHGHGNGNGNEDHGHGNGNDNGGGNGHGHDEDNQGDQGHGQGDQGHGHGRHGGPQYFRQQDYGYLQQYYDGPRDLPPGLRKKLYRTGSLPPGWQQRFRPMPPALVQQLPPVPAYYQRGYLDGYAVVINPRTRVVMDAVDIVGALSGR